MPREPLVIQGSRDKIYFYVGRLYEHIVYKFVRRYKGLTDRLICQTGRLIV